MKIKYAGPIMTQDKREGYVKYALKCFNTWNHQFIDILARGSAIGQAIEVNFDIEDHLKKEFSSIKLSKSCHFNFNDPNLAHYSLQSGAAPNLNFSSKMFHDCGNKIQDRITKITRYKDPVKHFELKPCIALKLTRHGGKYALQKHTSKVEEEIRELMKQGLITVPGGQILNFSQFREKMYGLN